MTNAALMDKYAFCVKYCWNGIGVISWQCHANIQNMETILKGSYNEFYPAHWDCRNAFIAHGATSGTALIVGQAHLGACAWRPRLIFGLAVQVA